MINFSKYALNKNTKVIKNLTQRSIFNSTQTNKYKKSNQNTIDLKSEFEEMIKATTISEEQMINSKKQEELKAKDNLKRIQKDFEDRNNRLKDEWEKSRAPNEESSKEAKYEGLKNKFKNVFYSNKSNSYSDSQSNKSKEKLDKISFSRFYQGLVSVWKQTFPGEENLDLVFEKRKAEAALLKSRIKEPTEDQIAEYEASTPEWKRGAVVMIQEEAQEKSRFSVFEFARNNMATHLKNLKIYQDAQKSFSNSEASLLIEDLKTSYNNVKDNIKESQNPFLVVTRDLTDRVSFKSTSAQATTILRKHDPNFDIILFEKEVLAIFKQLLTAYLKEDLDTVKLVSSEVALAMLTNDIKSRRERKIEFKYKEILFIKRIEFHSANIVDEDTVVLKYTINCHENNCKISTKDGSIVEGAVNDVDNVFYHLDIVRNPTPIIEEVGHSYLVVGIQRVGVMKQLI